MGERACRRDRVYRFCLYSVFSPDRGYWSTAFADCYLFDPPFAVLWGYLALGETINEGFIIGALMVCLSVWLVVGAEKLRQA
jgi:drug/metabolite transporter (DMT)-like permease